MTILMLGWEFPPFISGGLGTACQGLARALGRAGADVLFVLPRGVPAAYTSHVRLLSPQSPWLSPDDQLRPPSDDPQGQSPLAGGTTGGFEESRREPPTESVRFLPLPAALTPYSPLRAAGWPVPNKAWSSVDAPAAPAPDDYGGDLFAEVQRYARLVCRLARGHRFDVIHAHDWMTYPAALRAAAQTGKPLVVHVHSTEFDRSGEQVNPYIYRIERAGMHRAQAVLTVSHLTRGIATGRYGVAPEKVHVVYNAIEMRGGLDRPAFRPQIKGDRVVLFLGRMTRQKGPEYFVDAAERVLRGRHDVRFIMAGSGDLLGSTISRARERGLADRIIFPGFLRGGDVDRVYRLADVYVMPSVSEPFGLVALEAISHGVPTIVSKQSGVAEVLDHVLKVDYWDVQAIADGIATVLDEPGVQASLRDNARHDLARLSWDESARRCLAVYDALLRAGKKGSG